MCEKEPKRRSCTTCPQYDGMKCTATDFTLGPRDEVLQQEHRRGFICLDTGEAELKGDAVLQWTAEQERLRQEKGYKSCEEMWDAEGKQVKSGFYIDKVNKHLEPVLQVSNVKAVELEKAADKAWAQYNGLECRATDAWTRDNGTVLQVADAKSVDDTMYHPNVVADSTDLHSATVWPHKEGNTFKMTIRLADSDDSAADSPSSECPSLREGPPQKGKIAQKEPSHNSQRLFITLKPEATCCNCNKSYYEGLRLVCDKWGLRDIKMPERPCEKWALDPEAGVSLPASDSPLSTTVDNASLSKRGTIVAGEGIQLMESPVPLWKDTNDYWEPVRPRSCTNCKLYNDPICMQMASHIGKTEELREREKKEGFKCYAALPKEEYEAVITSIGCNSRKEIR